MASSRETDAIATAYALAAFAIGLPAFVMNKVFSPGFFAREDTKRPMMFAMTSVAVNVVGSFVLSRFIGHVGIALATALAAWVNATLLGVTLAPLRPFHRRSAPAQRACRASSPRASSWARSCSAAFIFVAADLHRRPCLWLRALVLIGLVALGGVSYFLLAHLFGAMKFAELKEMMRRGPA